MFGVLVSTLVYSLVTLFFIMFYHKTNDIIRPDRGYVLVMRPLMYMEQTNKVTRLAPLPVIYRTFWG
jgi:hypothetical protein